jgi:hypothetical protein
MIDLNVLTSSDQLLFILKYILSVLHNKLS